MRALWVVMALVCAVPASAPAYSIVISGFGFDLEVVNSRDRYSTGRVEFDMSQLLSLQPEEPIQSVTLMLFKTLDPSPRTPGIDLYGYAGDGNNSTPPTGEETLLASDIADGISNEVVQFDVTAFVEGLV